MHVVAGHHPHLVHVRRGGQLVTGDDRPVVDEALVAVHDDVEVQAEPGSNSSLSCAFMITAMAKVGGATTSG